MKIRDDRIANYSFHSISLGRREYPEQSQLLSPFLSTTHWKPSYLPLQQSSRAFPPHSEVIRGAIFPLSRWKSQGESQMQDHPPTIRQSRGRGGVSSCFRDFQFDSSQPRARQGRSCRCFLSLIFQGCGA